MKKSAQLSTSQNRTADDSIGQYSRSRFGSFAATTEGILESYEEPLGGAERQRSTFATTNFSGLSSSLKTNVYSSPPRSYTPQPEAAAAAAAISTTGSPVREYIEDVLHPERVPETSTGWVHVCINGNWRECHATADKHSRTLILTDTDGMTEVVQLKGMKAALSGRVTVKTRTMYEFRISPAAGFDRKSGDHRKHFATSDHKLAVSWVAVLNGASGHAENVERARAERLAEEEAQARREREERSRAQRQRQRPLSPPNVDVMSLVPLPPPVRSFYAEQYEEEQRVKRSNLDRFVAVRRLQSWWRGTTVRRNAPRIFWKQTYKQIAFRCARERSERLAACKLQKWTRFIVISAAQKERYRAALRRAFSIQVRELNQNINLKRLVSRFCSESVEWMRSFPVELWIALHSLHLQFNDMSLKTLAKPQQRTLVETLGLILPDSGTFLRDHHGSHCKGNTCRIIGAPTCHFPSAPRRLVRLAAVVGELRKGVQELQKHQTFQLGVLDMLAGLQNGAFQLAVAGYTNLALGEAERPRAEASDPDLELALEEAEGDEGLNRGGVLDRAGALAKAEEIARQWLSASESNCLDRKDRSNDVKVAFAQLQLATLLLEKGAEGTFEGAMLVRRAAGTFHVWLRSMFCWVRSLASRVIHAWSRAVRHHNTWRVWAAKLERLDVVEELGGWAYERHRMHSMVLQRSIRTWFGNGRLMARSRESMERAECFWEGVAAAQAVDLLYLAAYDSQVRLTALSEQLLRLQKKRLLVRWAAERRHNATLRHRAEIRLRKFYEGWLDAMPVLKLEQRMAAILQAFVRGSLLYRQYQRDTEKRFRLFVNSCSDERRVVHRSQLWCHDACVTIESGLAYAGMEEQSWQWLGCPSLWVRCTDRISGRSSVHHVGIGALMRFAESNEVTRPVAFGCLVRKLTQTMVEWLTPQKKSDAEADSEEETGPAQVMRRGAPHRWSYAMDISGALQGVKEQCSDAARREEAHVASFEALSSDLVDAARRLKVGARDVLSSLGDKLYKEAYEICFFEDVLAGKERAIHRKPLGREEWTYAGGWIKRRELHDLDVTMFRSLVVEYSSRYKAIIDTVRMLRRRQRLWELLAKDARFVRGALTASLDGNIAHVKDLADAALAYCRDALAAVCSGAFAKRVESMHRCDGIRESAFQLLELQQRGMGRFDAVVQSQMAALARDVEHLERLTMPMITGVEPHLEMMRIGAADILENFKNRKAIVADVQAKCRRDFADKMLKLYAPVKRKGPKAYVPKPPRPKWVGVRSVPKKYVQVYQDLMDRGPMPRKTSRQRWDIVRDRAQNLNLVMERFVNAVKEREDVTIKPSTLMKMNMGLKNIREINKAMGPGAAHLAEATRVKFEIFQRKVEDIAGALTEVFKPDDHRETRMLKQVTDGLPFILEKLQYIVRFPDKTAAGPSQLRRKQSIFQRRGSMFGGGGGKDAAKAAADDDGESDEDDYDGQVSSPIGDTLSALRKKAFGRRKWKHPKHLLTDTSVRGAFITIEQKETAAAILVQAASRRILYLWQIQREHEKKCVQVIQSAVRQRSAFRLLNGKRICRFVEGRKEFERKKRNMAAFTRGVHRLIAGERKQYKRGHKRFIKIYKDARGAGRSHYLDMETWTYCEEKPGHFPRRLDLPSPRSRRRAHRKLSVGREDMTEVEAAHVIQRLLGPLIQRDAGGYLPSQYPGFLLRGPREMTIEKAAVLVQNAWVQREEWKKEARRRSALWKLYS